MKAKNLVLGLAVAVAAAAALLANSGLLHSALPGGIEDPEPLQRILPTFNFVFYTGVASWMLGATRKVFEPAKFLLRIIRSSNAAVSFPELESRIESITRADGSQLTLKIDAPNKQQMKSQKPSPAILFLHGGGYVLNSPAEYSYLTGNLSSSLGVPVFSPDYRKSPAWTHPAALEDALATLRHLRSNAEAYGIDPERLLLGGDSAGGHLSIGVTLRLLQVGEAVPSALLLIYPATQLVTFCLPSHLENRFDVFLSESTACAFRLAYLVGDTADVPVWKASNHSSPAIRSELAKKFGLPQLASQCPNDIGGAGLDWAISRYEFAYRDWLLSPLFAPDELLAKFPPSLTQTCQFDVLRDEGRMFHERLVRAGAAGGSRSHRHRRYASVHGMYGFLRAGHAPAVATMDEAKTFVASVLGLDKN
ncbi:hypothetical protein BOX15_Mlig015949g1 [Macrostomum lignano]|uniref:Alpha/beta hydrolase fold-3 domain-containing protein n=1 Tax=Macrostomum lignano TaxID=282301 RepID=A0A267G5S0_9PLAT|nr:hypothetical protein BOX15_Mlig015949g1 [Macrostomum lignano]